jgi:subtilisin family serine protease
MDVAIEESSGPAARRALARSNQLGRRVSALAVGEDAPATFVTDEVVVDADDRDLVELLLARGGRIVRSVHDPELPAEARRAGLGRETPVDLTGLPRSVRIRYDAVPDVGDVDLGAILERADLRAERVRFSDADGAALTALIAPMRAEGRGVWLNEVGADHRTLPLRQPSEGAGLVYAANPFTWPSMTDRTRVAEAWQLIETLRLTRSAGGVVFVCIVDSGFWFDAPQTPGSAGAQTVSDLGVGALRWNAVDDVAGIPTGPGRSTWHGTSVASVAAAVVGNSAGAAGSGGSVAVPCYFFDDRSADSAKTAMIRCTQWGIPFVVYSGGFTSVEFFFGTSAWNDTFNWAADNGTLMIASAGNDDISLPDDAVLRPATRTPRALTVGALNDDGTKASFSNHGSSVGLWAPGVGIPVVPNPSAMAGSTLSGTSFSAPLVAGVAAMIRAANPALTVDQIRDTLVATGWDGAGSGGRGLDAYAAVWQAMAARMAENGAESPAERLFPRADGTFEPIFNSAVNQPSDRDEFLLDVPALSTVEIDVQWYERLSHVSIALEDTAPNATDPESTVSRAVGSVRLTAEVASGRYRIVVSGARPTAYLLSGRIRPGRLDPDAFEANDSFETATRLRVVGSGSLSGLFDLLGHGPGSFPLTLHSLGAGPATSDEDFFSVDVPDAVGVLQIPRLTVDSDEPVDVTVFDSARVQLTHEQGEHVVVNLELGTSSFVRVTGPTHTRYTLFVGTVLNKDALPGPLQEVRILPDWWRQVRPEHILDPEELRGVILGEELLADGQLVIGDGATGVLPESVRVELLDDTGELVAEAAVAAGRRVIELDGLAAGAYGLRISSNEETPVAITAQPPLLR